MIGGAPGNTTNLTCVSEKVNSATDFAGPPSTTRYYVSDQVGTAQLELTSGGWPLWKGEFTPFGQEIDLQSTANKYKFTGKERDAESGLDYFGARYYGSSMGRFMSPDYSEAGDEPDAVPYADFKNPQSLNLYNYAGNNPLSQVDQTGHYHCDPDIFNSQTNTLTAGACHLDFSDFTQFFRTMTRNDAKQIGVGILRETASYFDTGKNCPQCKVGIMPVGMIEGFGAKSIVSIIEQEPGAISLSIQTAKGEVEVMANMAKDGDKLILSNVHVSGEGLGPGLTKQAARELGAKEGVSEVVVQGGARTGGAVPGHTPVSFTVKVK